MASSPLYTKWNQLKSDKTATQIDDDDQSTTVPSDVMGATASDISAWDTGNLEDLSSCGVLSSAELRSARLEKQRLAAQPKAPTAQPKARSTTAPAVAKAKARAPPPAKAVPTAPPAAKAQPAPSGASHPKPAASRPIRTATAGTAVTASQASAGYAAVVRNKADLNDQSTATPDTLDESVSLEDLESLGGMTSAELRAARCQMVVPASDSRKPATAQSSRPKSAATSQILPQAKGEEKRQVYAGELDKYSREAIREMGLWEYMPARNPVVTRHTSKGADWNVGFEEYQHSLGGVPDVKKQISPQSHEADQLTRHFDGQSREAIKEMGLWEHMPAKNPVVTRQSYKGADWHIGFEEFVHTLGGVPDSQPVQRSHATDVIGDKLNRHFDINSRGAIKEMGLWEHMPARNPVVTKTSNKGAEWHVGFNEYVHTLGGIPDSKPVERPHHADQLTRHLDKNSREAAKKMGLSAAFGTMCQ